MTALLTATELRSLFETDLSDSALQIVIDSEEAEIVRRYGPHASASTRLPGGRLQVFLPRAAASITSVTEYYRDEGELTTDYTLTMGGWCLEHGTGAWGPVVQVDYVPIDETRQRKRVLVDLCKLAVNYNASTYETIGDYRVRGVDYTREREQLLRQLGGAGVLA